MNNKRIQANMQVDVSFLANTTQLVKQLESDVGKLNLNSTLGNKFNTTLEKGFKTIYSDLSKMTEGLSKKGLSTKQYTQFFNSMHDKLVESIKFTQTLKDDFQSIFNSPENKKALKDLDNLKKKLEEINKLASSQKGASTRRQTAIQKLKDETGIDYETNKDILNRIAGRQATKQGMTRAQQDWAKANGLDEAKLKRILELLKQINSQTSKVDQLNKKAKQNYGASTVEGAQKATEKKIKELTDYAITPEMQKQNLPILSQTSDGGILLNEEVTSLLPKLQTGLSASEKEAEKLAKAGMTIKEIFGQFGIAFSAAAIVRGFQDLTKTAFNFYKSLDSALNEIYVVSNLTIDQVNGLKSNFINMAKETGMAIDDVTRAAVLFYQQGLNTNEVLIMTEVTSQFAKVAGIDATDAADKLTAAVNGYCLAAEDASLVADKFNKVAAASAADINELSTAFSKAAAQANQAGVSMDNYLAYIATMEEATREAPENIGTSLKTIFSRMQQVKEGGTTEDGETDVNQVETALKSVGVTLRDTQGELRDLEDVFDELGPKWNSLDRNTQAYLGTIIAGTRQQSRFITLMQNWDRVLDLADQSANSAGMQALMHEKAMDSITSKVEQFQVAWQEFVSNLTDSTAIKAVISGLTKLVNVFNSGNKPVTLMAGAIGLLAIKLKDLQSPIITKAKEWGETINKALNSDLPKHKEQKQKIKDNADAQKRQQQVVLEQKQNIAALEQEISAKETLEEADKVALQDANNKLQYEEQRLAILKEQGAELKNQTTGRQAVGKGLIGLGTATQAIGLMASQQDDNLGGVISSAGSVMTSIGQFATGNWIGGIVTAATSIYQITQTIENWDENIKARIENSVNAVNDALTNYNNNTTGIKSADALIKKYDTLTKKLYKTQGEQQELNDTIQQLGDTYGVDVITDAYGNLSINIAEVNKLLDEQKAKQEESLKELDKTERESISEGISGWGNDTSVSEYMDKLFSTSRSQYRNLLNGIQDNLSDQTRNISDNLAQSFADNLKTSIVDEVQNNADEYLLEGLGNGVVNLEKSINEAFNSTPGAWEDLYSSITFLEQNIDDMSFDQAEDYLDRFYQKWGEDLNLTQNQWDVLKDSINNTVFQNDSLLNFFKEVNELTAKGEGTYWKNDTGTGKLDVLKNQLKTAWDKYNDSVSGPNKAGNFVGLNTADSSDFETYVENLQKGKDSTYGYGVNDIFRMKAGDRAADDVDNIAKAYKEAYEEMQNFYQAYSDEHNLDGVEDAEKYINALDRLSTAFQGVRNSTHEYLASIENLYDTEGMKGYEAEQYATSLEQVASAIDSMDVNATDADRYNYLARYYEHNKGTMEDGVKKQWEEILEEAFNDLTVSTPKTLKTIGTELKDISSGLIDMNNIIEEFGENGGLALDTFIDLAGIIDSINLDELGKLDPSAIDAYIQAMQNLNLAYDENTGYITMNADSVATLQDIQELQVKSKIAGMINELKASRATVETQLAYIDAQIAATDAAIQVAKLDTENTVTGDQVKAAANSAFTTDFDNSMAAITGAYENDATNQGQWSTTILSNLGTVADAWSKYFTGIANGSVTSLEEVKNQANNILKDVQMKWEGAGDYSGIDWSKYDTITKGSEQQEQLLADLQSYRSKLENTRKSYQATLDLTNQEIGLLEKMYDSDLGNLKTSSGKEKEQKIETYIGQLKEIYNILNRIQMLEHRLSTLDTYADISIGERYGKLLQQRLDYNEQLLSQYDFLVSEQKQFTNGYKDFINSVDGLEGVFDFDQFGQIIINWDKYIALQDEAVNGEVTLKQKADDVYETYTNMFKELQDDFDKYIQYLKQVIDLQQEMIDSYIEMQDKAADAVKEIYQKILDTKLDAIDEEKEALEELRKAREQARKDQENAEAVSGLQTNLQRAMMDTSGASDSDFIKAQQDLDDKLNEIAEDKYSEMLDNISQQLDEEQDALQREFDEMFDHLDWLFEWLDSDVMLNEERLRELFEQTDEWNQASPLRRKELVDDWDTRMATYMSGLQGNSTIYDVYNAMVENRNRIDQLDASLVNNMSKESKEIVQTIKSWQTSVNDTINNAMSKAASYYSGGSSGGGVKTGGTGDIGNKGNETPVADLGGANDNSSGYAFNINQKVTSNVGMLMDGYKYDSKGNLKKPPTQSGWDSNKLWTSGDSMYVTRRDSYNGTNYYGLSYSKGGTPIVWANGHQIKKFATGGLANFTGPAWLDGTSQQPEAVLNALQTAHFIKFTDALDKIAAGRGATNTTTSSVSIDNISFNVESMSSTEDGEKAFNMFVDKFKEIGNRTGIKVNTFKNTL